MLEGKRSGLAAFEDVEDDVEVLGLEVVPPLFELADLLEIILGEFDLFGRSVDEDVLSADGQADVQAASRASSDCGRGRRKRHSSG